MFLANNPGYDTASAICACLAMKPSIVSLYVEQLAKAGYVERCAVEGDRRKHCLRCTEKSAALIEQGRGLQREFLARMTRGLSEEELKTFVHCLTVFEENLT